MIEDEQESPHVKEALNQRLRVIHNWTYSFVETIEAGVIPTDSWWYARIIYTSRLWADTELVGPYSTRAALIQSSYEIICDRMWHMVNK